MAESILLLMWQNLGCLSSKGQEACLLEAWGGRHTPKIFETARNLVKKTALLQESWSQCCYDVVPITFSIFLLTEVGKVVKPPISSLVPPLSVGTTPSSMLKNNICDLV